MIRSDQYLTNSYGRTYILVGEKPNWEVALEKNVWGFTERSKGLWNKSEIGEFLAFYVTAPTKKIIGFGQITGKFVSEKLLWKDEFRFKRPLWKYRIDFKPFYVVNNWEKGISVPTNLMLCSSRTVIDQKQFFNFVNNADNEWRTNINKKFKMIIPV